MVYLDTSALAKWYLNEPHSEEFTLWIQDQADVHISSLTVAEMRCLLARRRRRHELSMEMEQKVMATFQDDIAQGFLTLHPTKDEHITSPFALSKPTILNFEALIVPTLQRHCR